MARVSISPPQLENGSPVYSLFFFSAAHLAASRNLRSKFQALLAVDGGTLIKPVTPKL